MFSVDAVVWLMEHMEEVNTEMKAIQVNSGTRQRSRIKTMEGLPGVQ
jgi:hypothetical protein